jgi:hypothetical protein
MGFGFAVAGHEGSLAVRTGGGRARLVQIGGAANPNRPTLTLREGVKS